ncbi:flagellar biosynthesis anti-sigma factor FlgM [Bacillus sp. FJAT-45066]|uniref:flagellar biosynthesis anti-sigma factor FlgM n=1 Tax=Bacillus sp. FJAT-45066 TaxID=2011010 RepID=UPI000BB788DF|nr:flagellar biosynthesis anti-sigma factor FlgM [Bacillus sp. FJAT-45066]
MKINNIGQMGVNPYRKQMEKPVQQSNTGPKSDKVEISSEAKGLQETSQFQEARTEKVAQLKIAVQNGTYQVDVKQVAAKMTDYYFGK